MSDYGEGNGERRVNWARTVADVAVIKEMQVQQTAALAALSGKVSDVPVISATVAKMSEKVDQLWDKSQRDIGARDNERNANLRWRWYLGTAIAGVAVVVGLIQAKVI